MEETFGRQATTTEDDDDDADDEDDEEDAEVYHAFQQVRSSDVNEQMTLFSIHDRPPPLFAATVFHFICISFFSVPLLLPFPQFPHPASLGDAKSARRRRERRRGF